MFDRVKSVAFSITLEKLYKGLGDCPWNIHGSLERKTASKKSFYEIVKKIIILKMNGYDEVFFVKFHGNN